MTSDVARNPEVFDGRARAKEFGGMMQTSAVMSTKLFSSNAFGSTMVELMLVKILNSREQRTS